MKTVTLNPVAITDLSVKYARPMGGNKLRHYRVSHLNYILGGGTSALEHIKNYIEKEEGESVEFIVNEAPSGRPSVTGAPLVKGTALQVEDATQAVFGDGKNNDIKKSLDKRKVKSLIVEREDLPLLKSIYNRVAYFLNKNLIGRINRVLLRIQGKNPNEWDSWFTAKSIRLLPLYYGRVFDMVHFISIGFEEKQAEEAKNALLADLRVLQDMGLINGVLAPPSIIRLADTVGAGEKYYSIFCFPVIDSKKLNKIFENSLGVTEVPIRNPLSRLVKYSNSEGSISNLDGKDFDSKWDIEVVDVLIPGELSSDDARQAYIDSCEKQGKVLAKISEDMAKKLEKKKE